MIKQLDNYTDKIFKKYIDPYIVKLGNMETPDWLESVIELPDKVRYFFRHLYQWVVKSVQYSGFLWNDGDYDYNYIYKLLRYKIQRTRNHLNEHNMMIPKELNKRLRDMDTAILLLDKLISGDFCTEEYKLMDKKWGKHIFKKSHEYGLSLTRSKVKTEQDKKEESKDIRRVGRLEVKRCNQCRRRLFRFLEKNIEYWWD